MRIIRPLIIVLGLAVAILPQLYTCQAHGFDIELRAGAHIPMVCLWTAHMEEFLGILLVIIGIMLYFWRARETAIVISILAIIIGFGVLVTPMGNAMNQVFLWSIGTCVNPDMPCVVVMRPALYLLGPIVMATGIGGLLLNVIRLRPE